MISSISRGYQPTVMPSAQIRMPAGSTSAPIGKPAFRNSAPIGMPTVISSAVAFTGAPPAVQPGVENASTPFPRLLGTQHLLAMGNLVSERVVSPKELQESGHLVVDCEPRLTSAPVQSCAEAPLPVTVALNRIADFDAQLLGCVKLLAADLDKTLYPNGMGNATVSPKPEARDEFDRNIQGFMDFMRHGGLAIPVTGNSPALAQQKFNRSREQWIVEENPGVFCNGSLVLGVGGVVEYSNPVPSQVLRQLQAMASQSDGYFEFEGVKYPFAINLMTKSQVMFIAPGITNLESHAIADGWASMQLMTSETASVAREWDSDPAYQVNILLKSKSDLLKQHPDMEQDAANKIGKIQTALLADIESKIWKLSDFGCQGKHVLAPWCETNIVMSGVNKGQSLNRFIHCTSVVQQLGHVNVATDVIVAGDAANDLPMFLPWGHVDDFNGMALPQTDRPGIRIIMPDAEDDKLTKESNLKNKVWELLAAVQW